MDQNLHGWGPWVGLLLWGRPLLLGSQLSVPEPPGSPFNHGPPTPTQCVGLSCGGSYPGAF